MQQPGGQRVERTCLLWLVRRGDAVKNLLPAEPVVSILHVVGKSKPSGRDQMRLPEGNYYKLGQLWKLISLFSDFSSLQNVFV